jgi:hypothetical protein
MATDTTGDMVFSRPQVGADTDDWGQYLNDNWQKIDEILSNTNTIKINIDNYTVDGITITNTDSADNPVEITAQTMTFAGGVAETVYTGLAGSGTLTSLASGEFTTLRITSVGSDTVSFPTDMEWIGGSAPTLSATGTNWVHLWNVGGTLYGSFIGTSS